MVVGREESMVPKMKREPVTIGLNGLKTVFVLSRTSKNSVQRWKICVWVFIYAVVPVLVLILVPP